MKTATELRAEAQRMRAFALTVGDDAEVVTEIHAMADELEGRALALEKGASC